MPIKVGFQADFYRQYAIKEQLIFYMGDILQEKNKKFLALQMRCF